ncbi:MAG: hypothetical protein AAGB26_04280 [Planctomycetota bacterium]
MADRQNQIEIPERLEHEAPASPEQLQLIRQLVSGLALHGYRFDYIKLGTDQASAIIDQLLALQAQQGHAAPQASKPRKQGPGCIASFAKGTTALIVWAVVLSGVAGGGYLIYWQMNQAPDTADTTENPFDDDAASNSPNQPGNRSTDSESKIFEGLGISDDPAPFADRTPNELDTPDTTLDATPPTPGPVPDPSPRADPARSQQLLGVENLLVQLSQFTRSDFALDVRIQSSEAMQKKLDTYPAALSALDARDSTLSARIRAIIDAFAGDTIDGPAIREEIKSIRKAMNAIK